MKLSEVKQKYVFTTRIELPVDDEKKENDEVEFIELREPNLQEIKDIQVVEESKMIDAYERLFPICLINSSFTDEDGKEANAKDVYNALKNSGTLFTDILATWIQSCPFQSRLKKLAK